MQSWLGSKKKAAWNIDIFNLKILESNKELPWRKRANIRNYSMFEHLMAPSNSYSLYAVPGIRKTLSHSIWNMKTFFAHQHGSLSFAAMDPLILTAHFTGWIMVWDLMKGVWSKIIPINSPIPQYVWKIFKFQALWVP